MRGGVGDPAPLRALYLLDGAAGSSPSSPRRLEGVAAFEALLAQTYRPELPRLLDMAEAHVARCGSLLAHAACFALPWRGALTQDIGGQVDRLEAHMAAAW